MSSAPRILRVAVPAPLRQCFDYLCPEEIAIPPPGTRVRVPFGQRRRVIGVVLGHGSDSDQPIRRLKPIVQRLDDAPVLSSSMLELLQWAAEYYHYPIGEVIANALPAKLRQGEAAVQGVRVWTLTAEGAALAESAFKRFPAQRRLWLALKSTPEGIDSRSLGMLSARWRPVIEKWSAKGWVSTHLRDGIGAVPTSTGAPFELTDAQLSAINAISGAQGFQPFLLHGITGSGKTEVYLRVIDAVLQQQRQALVLVPEISLTPQLAARFRARFSVPVAILHSNLNDQERACAWLMAQSGKALIVLGTRSAVFTPMPRLGVIVVDEEHDASYKQQDGFRYSARDVAMMRAHREQIPIVLGSATPSLESLQRVNDGAYQRLVLPQRTGGAALPAIGLLDLRRLAIDDGLSHPLRQAMTQTLERHEQVLLFLNRRGFAPVWMCYGCGWVAPCRRCDARLTFHRASARLRCHHCGAEHELPEQCPSCRATELHALGEGTERVEAALTRFFPAARVLRIDRDSTRAKGSLEQMLKRIHDGDADILIGTQILSKGHDFPNVTLVGVLNADQGLYSSDFRAAERLVQQIMQVSGRAGRARKPGQVLIQTYHPDHPVFAALMQHRYEDFAEYALSERRVVGYPPFNYLALLRAEASASGAALAFLRKARHIGLSCGPATDVQFMEPVPSPMERRAGRYRAQLLVQAGKRAPLHSLLSCWITRLSALTEAKRVRWSLDVDPIDMY